MQKKNQSRVSYWPFDCYRLQSQPLCPSLHAPHQSSSLAPSHTHATCHPSHCTNSYHQDWTAHTLQRQRRGRAYIWYFLTFRCNIKSWQLKICIITSQMFHPLMSQPSWISPDPITLWSCQKQAFSYKPKNVHEWISALIQYNSISRKAGRLWQCWKKKLDLYFLKEISCKIFK